MGTKKKPYKNYAVINISAAFKLGCSDIYRFFILSLTAHKKTRQTDTTLEQLADLVGEKPTAYKGGKTTKSFTDRLRDSKEVVLETFEDKSYKTGKRVTRIKYTFNEAVPFNYRRIKRSLTELNLSPVFKGYLIKLCCITEPHSLLIKKSQNEMCQLLSMGVNTIRKYNRQLIEAGCIEKTDDGLLLKIDFLELDLPSNNMTEREQKFIEDLEKNIISKQIVNIPLSVRDNMYLKAKNQDFKNIKNMRNWVNWLMSSKAVCFKSKHLKITLINIY